MMENLSKVLEYIFDQGKTRTLKGLIMVCLALLALIFSLLVGIQVLKSYYPSASFIPEFDSTTIILFFLIPQVSWIIYWISLKISERVVLTDRKKYNIAFSVIASDSHKDWHYKILKAFSDKIKNIDKFSNLKVDDITSHFQFTDSLQAEKFINSEQIGLLIWGDSEEGTIDNEDVLIYNLKFTYNSRILANSPEDIANKKSALSVALSNALTQRRWDIVHSQTIRDIIIVSNNLTEVSLYISCVCLLSRGFTRLCYEYSLGLLNNLNYVKDRDKFPDYIKFKSLVTNLVIQSSVFLAGYYLSAEKNLSESEKAANNALSLDASCYPALTIIANVCWQKGDKDAARRYANRAKNIQPENNINRFNEAFFALDRADFKKALTMYKKIKDLPKDLDILFTIDFIEEEYKKTKNPAMLFAVGLLNCQYADDVRGVELLNQFVQITDDSNSFALLRDRAKTVIVESKNGLT